MGLLHSIKIRAIPKPVRRVLNKGTARHCPVCGADVKAFLPFGTPTRPQAQCPVCFSLERHRLIWLYLQKHSDLFDGKPKKMLHIAPEPQLGHLFRALPGVDYTSADMAPGKAMLVADVTKLPFDAHTFDVVFCSHVLEHVPDDHKAMTEFRRVLKPTGWAILQVPIKGEKTFEDPSVTTPEERLRVFGQDDHVRIYGADYVDRLRKAGFAVTVTRYTDTLPPADVERMNLDKGEDIFHCRPA